jgi:hypothetical protein
MPTKRPAAWSIKINSKIPAECPDLHATADEVQRSVARLEVSDRFIQRSPPNIYGIVRPHSRLNASHVLLQTLCNQNIMVKSAKNKKFLCRCEWVRSKVSRFRLPQYVCRRSGHIKIPPLPPGLSLSHTHNIAIEQNLQIVECSLTSLVQRGKWKAQTNDYHNPTTWWHITAKYQWIKLMQILL